MDNLATIFKEELVMREIKLLSKEKITKYFKGLLCVLLQRDKYSQSQIQEWILLWNRYTLFLFLSFSLKDMNFAILLAHSKKSSRNATIINTALVV